MQAFSRSRRRYDVDPPFRVLTRGLVVLALLGGFIWLAARLYNGVPGRDYQHVDATVQQLGSLLTHDPVRIGGVRVGQVASIGSQRDGQARIGLQLEPGTKLTSDTGIRLRANGLLGARYVELVPGRSATPLAPGQTLRGDDNSLTYGVTDVLDALDRRTRRGLGTTLGELGTGLAGHGRDVNDLLRVGADDIGPTSELFGRLNQSSDALHRLLPGVQAGTAAVDPARDALLRAARQADPALTPFVAERPAVRATLAAAPAALTVADAGLTEGRPLVLAARGLSVQLRHALPPAPAALRAARALLVEARRPLKRVRPVLASARTTVPTLLRMTKALDPVLGPARGLFAHTEPILRVIAPYGCDVQNFGAVFRSMTGFGSKAPGGPGGAPMEFRLQAVGGTGSEALGLADTSGGELFRREGVGAPCQHPSRPYPIINRPQVPGGKR